MNLLSAAQLGAMLASLIVSSMLALYYYVPWTARTTRRNALLLLLWLHVPRYITLIMYSAQRDGYPISNRAAFEAVLGDVLGAAVAIAAVAMIESSQHWLRSAAVGLSWLLVVETFMDMVVGVARKAHEPLWGKAGGVTWLILDFYIPILIVTLPLLAWQLLSRRREPMSGTFYPIRRSDSKQPAAPA